MAMMREIGIMKAMGPSDQIEADVSEISRRSSLAHSTQLTLTPAGAAIAMGFAPFVSMSRTLTLERSPLHTGAAI